MTMKKNSRANALAGVIILFALLALSWPILEIPLAPCQAAGAAFSADLLARCALKPLLWMIAIWVLLLVALALRSLAWPSKGRPHE